VSTLISNIRDVEKYIGDSLDYFNTTRRMILYYEDIIRNRNVLNTYECPSDGSITLPVTLMAYLCVQALLQVQKFLGVPVRKLVSRQVKIHTRPLPDLVRNWEDVNDKLNGTEYARFLDGADYLK
jgi:hypothetical protein